MKRRFCALIAVLFLLLTSCAGKDAAPFAAFAPPESKRLCVYTSHKEEVYLPIVREFEERTGIWVEVVTGGTTELLERIESEAKAPRCDVMFGGGGESLTAYAALFEPYTCGGIDAAPAEQAVRLPADFSQAVGHPDQKEAAVYAAKSHIPVCHGRASFASPRLYHRGARRSNRLRRKLIFPARNR